MNVLFLATRPPYGKMHGHKMGIRTYVRSLQRLGHRVIIGAFSIPGDDVDREDLGAPTVYLPLPSIPRVLLNILAYWLRGIKSLNECLYYDPRLFGWIAELCKDYKIEFAVADMIRTASYIDATGLPWFLDLDDLLSERYRMQSSRSSGNDSILGYLAGYVPARLHAIARTLFCAVLSREADILERREVYWTDRAITSSLRSLDETDRLCKRSRKRLFHMPVTVPIPLQVASSLTQRPMSAVFTGGLTYQPNLDALREYVDRIIPAFARASITPPSLSVIGAAPAALKVGLEHPTIRFLGYVPDVNDELLRHQVFFAPIVSGTGIKTKVLEGMACGLPVLVLPAGATGLSGEAGRHYLLARDADEFARIYAKLRDNPKIAARIGAAGRELAVSNYSVEASTRILDRELQRAGVPAPLTQDRRPFGRICESPESDAFSAHAELAARRGCRRSYYGRWKRDACGTQP